MAEIVTNPSDTNRMRELGRRGGIASGEARRKRRARGWFDEWLDDLEAVAREVRATGNGASKVRMTELALESKRERLAEREAELEERDRRLSRAERKLAEELDDMEQSRADFAEWEAEAELRYDALEAELDELERQRDELRAGVARGAGMARHYEGEVSTAEPKNHAPATIPVAMQAVPADKQTPGDAPPEEPEFPPETDADVLERDPPPPSEIARGLRSSEAG